MKNLILLNKVRHSQGIPLNDDVEFSVINNDNDIKYVTADVSNPNADQDLILFLGILNSLPSTSLARSSFFLLSSSSSHINLCMAYSLLFWTFLFITLS